MLKLVRRKPGGPWYIRGTFRIAGTAPIDIFETTGTDNEEHAETLRAKKEAELFKAAIHGGGRPAVRFDKAALNYLNFEPRSSRTEDHVNRLIAHFGGAIISTIGQDEADAAVTAIVGDDAEPATKRRAVYGPLTTILTHGYRRKWCDLPKFDKPKLPRGNTRWLTPAEAAALLDAAAPHLQPLVTFLLCTGARLSEALDLEWADVDLGAGHVMLRDTKNTSDRKAALTLAATVAIAKMPHRDGKVFRTDDGDPYADHERLSGGQIKSGFTAACRRGGLFAWVPGTEAQANALWANRLYTRKIAGPFCPIDWAPTLTPHDLRHTWASWFYGLSKDFLLLKDEGGWRSLAMVQRYAHLVPSHVLPGVAAIWGGEHPRIRAIPEHAPAQETKIA